MRLLTWRAAADMGRTAHPLRTLWRAGLAAVVLAALPGGGTAWAQNAACATFSLFDPPTEVAEGETGEFIVSARANQDTTIAVRFDDLGDGIDLDIGEQPATRPRIRRGTAVNSDEDTLYFELTGDSAATCTTETPSVLSFDLTVADDDADRGNGRLIWWWHLRLPIPVSPRTIPSRR